MTRPLILLALASLVFLASNEAFGYGAAYRIAYGAFTLMAAMISLIFLWLWARRATPLAIGMSFGWAGAASVMGWWWTFNVLQGPEWMVDNPLLLVFLSVYFVGATLHFQVISRSFGTDERGWIWPVATSLAVSLAVHLLA